MASDILLKVRRGVGTPDERDALISPGEAIKPAGTDVIYCPELTLTLNAKHQGVCLLFTAGCTVTVPHNLPGNFSMGWAQAGANPITFVAGEGVALRSLFGLRSSSGQYAMGALGAMATNEIWVYGALT